MNTELFQSVVALVQKNIESGAIDRDRVRQIVLGISRDGQSIKLWQQERWDDYNEYEDDAAVGEISNLEWLDRLDRVSFGEDQETAGESSPFLPRQEFKILDADLGERYRRMLTARIAELTAVLKRVATEQALGEFSKLVGLMGLRVSNSNYADLVAIYHPMGADLLPCSERRLPGYSSIYGAAACTPEGLIHFYPESDRDDDDFDDDGDDDDESEGEEGDVAGSSGGPAAAPRSFNHYRFADMDLVQIDDGEVVFRLISSGQSIEMGGGHTHEEWGGLTRQGVEQRLVAHFQDYAGHLFFDAESMPVDQAAWERWLTLYEKQDKKQPLRVLREALDTDNPEGARRFLEKQTLTEKEEQSVRERYVDHAFKRKEYGEVIRLAAEFPPSAHSPDLRDQYYRALLTTGDPQRVYELSLEGLADSEIDEELYRVQACYRFIAAYILELEPGAAISLERVAESSAKDPVYRLARALELYANAPEQSLDIVHRLLRERRYNREFGEADFQRAPELLALCRWYHDSLDDGLRFDAEGLKTIVPDETRALQSAAAYRESWRTGEQLERYALTEDFEELEETQQTASILYQNGSVVWAALPEKGFARVIAGAERKLKLLQHAGEYSVDALAVSGTTLVTSCSGEIFVYRCDPADADSAPELLSRTLQMNPDRCEAISVAGELLALSTGREVEIYDLSDARQPRLRKLIQLPRKVNDSYTSCSQLLVAADRLYLMLYDTACYALDLADPGQPQLRGAVNLPFTCTGGMESGGLLALYGSSHLQFVDFRDPEAPRGVTMTDGDDRYEWVLPLPARDSAFRFLCADKEAHVHEIICDSDGGVRIGATRPAMDRETGNYARIYDPMAILEIETGCLAVTSDETHLFECEAMPAYSGFTAEQLALCAQNLELWLRTKFAEFHQKRSQDLPGLVLCDGNGRELKLFLDCQRSLPGLSPAPLQLLAPGAFPFAEYSADWYELAGVSAPEGEAQYDDLSEQSRAADVLNQKAMSVAALQKFSQTAEFRQTVPGPAYLISRFEYSCEIFAQLPGDGAWQPQRRELKTVAELPLSEILSDSNRWESMAEKAGGDQELKSELYELGRGGDYGALQVIRRRLHVPDDDAVTVLLDVVLNREQYFWLHFLDNFTGREDVQSVYRQVYDRLLERLAAPATELAAGRGRGGEGNWTGALVDVAIGLKYQDRPELDPLLDRLLLKEGADYSDYDIATKLLAAKSDVVPYVSTIRTALAKMEPRENRLPALAEQLFRAGVIEIPEGLLLQSAPEKSGEQYADQKIGIKSLDKVGDSQYDVCRIERLFTAKLTLERFREFRQKQDRSSPLWPPELKPEPYPGSWKFFLRSLLDQMNQDEELDALIEHLCLRLKAGDEYSADRGLFKGLFQMLVESRERDRFSKMIAAVQDNTAAFGEEESRKLNKLREGAEINIAWQANQDGDRATARDYTDRLLAEGLKSWHLFFLDARLSWLEYDDPGRAVELGRRHLEERLHGGSGKALLLNLVGCAHDELMQYPEALACFQEASNMDPDQVFLFDNIAEIYQKMGEASKALEWAREAKRRGSKSQIIKEILASGAAT